MKRVNVSWHVLFLIAVLILEKTVGLPLLSLAATWLIWESISTLPKQIAFWLGIGWLLAVLYTLPFTAALLILLVLKALMIGLSAIKSSTIRLVLIVSIIGLGIAWYLNWEWTAANSLIAMLSWLSMITLSRIVIFYEQRPFKGIQRGVSI